MSVRRTAKDFMALVRKERKEDGENEVGNEESKEAEDTQTFLCTDQVDTQASGLTVRRKFSFVSCLPASKQSMPQVRQVNRVRRASLSIRFIEIGLRQDSIIYVADLSATLPTQIPSMCSWFTEHGVCDILESV